MIKKDNTISRVLITYGYLISYSMLCVAILYPSIYIFNSFLQLNLAVNTTIQLGTLFIICFTLNLHYGMKLTNYIISPIINKFVFKSEKKILHKLKPICDHLVKKSRTCRPRCECVDCCNDRDFSIFYSLLSHDIQHNCTKQHYYEKNLTRLKRVFSNKPDEYIDIYKSVVPELKTFKRDDTLKQLLK